MQKKKKTLPVISLLRFSPLIMFTLVNIEHFSHSSFTIIAHAPFSAEWKTKGTREKKTEHKHIEASGEPTDVRRTRIKTKAFVLATRVARSPPSRRRPWR